VHKDGEDNPYERAVREEKKPAMVCRGGVASKLANLYEGRKLRGVSCVPKRGGAGKEKKKGARRFKVSVRGENV